MRTFNRMFMRADLPIKYSEGFNPHILLNFALPLSVGVTSERDFAEITLSEFMDNEEIKQRLVKAAPEGIEITDVTNDDKPAFKDVYEAEFTINLVCNKKAADIISYLEHDSILTEKKTKKGIKEVDIKPMIFKYHITDSENTIVMKLNLAAGNTINLNPSLILKAAHSYIDNLEIDSYTIERNNLYAQNKICF